MLKTYTKIHCDEWLGGKMTNDEKTMLAAVFFCSATTGFATSNVAAAGAVFLGLSTVICAIEIAKNEIIDAINNKKS